MSDELAGRSIIPSALLTQVTGWEPGDVVIDDDGTIWTRAHEQSIREGWPWSQGAETTRSGGKAYAPEGGAPEFGAHGPVRPLTLLVRGGHAVTEPKAPSPLGSLSTDSRAPNRPPYP